MEKDQRKDQDNNPMDDLTFMEKQNLVVDHLFAYVNVTQFDSLLSYDVPIQLRSDVNMYFPMYLQKPDLKLSVLIPDWHIAYENITKLCPASLVTASYGKIRIRRNVFTCVGLDKKKMAPRTPVRYGQDFYLRVYDSDGPELYLTGCPPPYYDNFGDTDGKIPLSLTENPSRLAMFRIVDPDPNRMIALQDLPVPANFIVCVYHTYTNQLISVDLTEQITSSYTFDHPVNGCTYKDSSGQITSENYWTFITRAIYEISGESMSQLVSRPSSSSVATEEVRSDYPSTSTVQYPRTSTPLYSSTSTAQYPSTSTAQYPSTSTSQYPSTSTSRYRSTSVLQYLRTSTSQYPSTSTSQHPSTGTSQYPSTSASKYPSTSALRYPSTSTSQYPSTSTAQYRSTSTSQFPDTSISPIPAIGPNDVISLSPSRNKFPETRSNNLNYPTPNVNTVPAPTLPIPWNYPPLGVSNIPVAAQNAWIYPGPAGNNYPSPLANPLNYPVASGNPVPVIANSMWSYPSSTNYPSMNYYRYPGPGTNYATSTGTPYNYLSRHCNNIRMKPSSSVKFPSPSTFPVAGTSSSSQNSMTRPKLPRFSPSVGPNPMTLSRYRGPISNEYPKPGRTSPK